MTKDDTEISAYISTFPFFQCDNTTASFFNYDCFDLHPLQADLPGLTLSLSGGALAHAGEDIFADPLACRASVGLG